MAPTAARLLRDLDPLPYPARTRLAVRVALEYAGTAEFGALLADLHGRGRWERRLGLQLADVAGDLDHVDRCIAGGDPTLARRAIGSAVRLGIGADRVVQLLPDLPAAVRVAFAKALRIDRRPDLADAVVSVVRERFGDHQAAAVLPACSVALVARELPGLAHAISSWRTLARTHPAVFLDHAEREVESAPEPLRAATLARFEPGLAALAPREPDRVLALLGRCADEMSWGGPIGRVLGALARHDPAAVRDLLLTYGPYRRIPTGRALWRALLALDDASLTRLIRATGLRELPVVLRVLPPARRPRCYLPLFGTREDVTGRRFPLEVLDLLPYRTRHDEATRLSALRSVADDPPTRIAVTARLPWAEAENMLRAAIERPDADDRAAAYPLLVLAATGTRDPHTVEATITSLTRLRNEQDPVRCTALRELARVPGRLLTDRSAQALRDQADAALQARDASHLTTSAVDAIGEQLIIEGSVSQRPLVLAAGLRVLQSTGDHLDRFRFGRLIERLPHGTEKLVYEAFADRLRADRRAGRHDALFALAQGMGRRAWAMPDLQRRLGQACRARSDTDVRQAVTLWLEPPSTRDDRVEVVLRADRSTVVIPSVAHCVAARRTDLLDDVLGRPQHGRFLKRGVRQIPSIAEFAERWLPRQAERYRTLLADLAASPKAAEWERAQAVRQLGRVPGSLDVLRRHLDDPVPQVADAALTAIAWVDEPDAVLGDLTNRASTDRAHIASAALTRCARFVVPSTLAPALIAVLRTGKVTARKEACRLLAQQRLPGSVDTLVDALADPGQHRDVRRSVVSALRHLLDDERVWSPLADAAIEPSLATAVLDVGSEWIALRHRGRYAALVGHVAASPDAETALRAVRVASAWLRWDDAQVLTALAESLATDFDNTMTWSCAVDVLVDDAERSGELSRLHSAIVSLLDQHRTADLDDPVNATAQRDLPARQRVALLADGLRRAARRNPALCPAGVAVAEAIAAHPLCEDIAVELAAGTVPWDEPVEAPEHLRALVALCTRPTLASRAADRAGGDLTRMVRSLPADAPLGPLRALRADPSTAAALLAVAVVAALGSTTGWSEELRQQLRELRRHPDTDARLAAAGVYTSAE